MVDRRALVDDLVQLSKDLEAETGSKAGVILVRHGDEGAEADLSLPESGHTMEIMAHAVLSAAHQVSAGGASNGCPDCIERAERVGRALAILEEAGGVSLRTGEETQH